MEREFWKKYKSKGLQVIGVNSFEEESPTQQAKAFARKHKLTYPVVADVGDRIAKTFGLEGLPSQVIIDRNGTIRYINSGSFDRQRVKSMVETWLRSRETNAKRT